MFRHNKWKHDFIIVVNLASVYVLAFIAINFILSKQQDLSMLVAPMVGFSIILVVACILKVPEDYQLNFEGHKLTGASSYNLFRKISTIDLTKPFAIKKTSRAFMIISVEGYQVLQNEKTIYFSKLAIGDKGVHRLLQRLSKYPHVKLDK